MNKTTVKNITFSGKKIQWVFNVIKLRIDSYQGIQTKCMPFLFSLDKSPKM